MEKHVYFFGNGKADGSGEMKNLLGGKGANLAEMNHLGIPVPPGFTITTDVCTHYYKKDNSLPKGTRTQTVNAVKEIEKTMQFLSRTKKRRLSRRAVGFSRWVGGFYVKNQVGCWLSRAPRVRVCA